MTVNYKLSTIFISGLLLLLGSCKKLIEIDAPVDTITTGEVFENNKQAEWAIAGVYSRMINGNSATEGPEWSIFSAGLATMAGSLSADDVTVPGMNSTPSQYVLSNNALNPTNASIPEKIWQSAYKTIYDANGVIEGIEASESTSLTDSARKQITAEARAIRAFSYFYLVNFFGDVPLVLTIDHSKTKNMTRTPKEKVYEQIVKDLQYAQDHLANDFRIGNNERIRINKWFAEGFLARVYLYLGRYQDAVNSATEVINQTNLFKLESEPNNVFLKNNTEAIWQLQQNSIKNDRGVPEGRMFMPISANNTPLYPLSEELLNAFEPTDKRLDQWTAYAIEAGTGNHMYYAYKYKVVRETGVPSEYCTVLRLAEMYLIRAEAQIHLSPSNVAVAVGDLNLLRQRANVDDLPATLTPEEVKEAVAAERQRELFAEWAHRWFDLKRTGKASEVLPVLLYKQPWLGDYQLLYPIPVKEIEKNNALTQNPEYNSR
jgi:SusD family.